MASDYGGMPTRYGAMLGTPERAARTIAEMCGTGVMNCDFASKEKNACPFCELCGGWYRAPRAGEMADWLRGGLPLPTPSGTSGARCTTNGVRRPAMGARHELPA